MYFARIPITAAMPPAYMGCEIQLLKSIVDEIPEQEKLCWGKKLRRSGGFFIHIVSSKSKSQRRLFIHIVSSKSKSQRRLFIHIVSSKSKSQRRVFIHIVSSKSKSQRRLLFIHIVSSKSKVTKRRFACRHATYVQQMAL